jgi:hypothetical protein
MFYGTISQEEGRHVFNRNCTACHKLYKKATGSALSGVAIKNFPSTDYLTKFILNEDGLEGLDKKYAEIINEEYQYDFQHKLLLSEIKRSPLATYLKQNALLVLIED